MKIKHAQTAQEIAEVRKLFRNYEAYLNVELCFQGFENEVAEFPGEYKSPTGSLLIGLEEEKIVGCVAVRKIGDGICEMKRLFVRPEVRQNGVGLKLALAIIDTAKELGYSTMRLDTLKQLTVAMHLYRKLGFRTIEPYYTNPLPGVVYWELNLNEKRNGQSGKDGYFTRPPHTT